MAEYSAPPCWPIRPTPYPAAGMTSVAVVLWYGVVFCVVRCGIDLADFRRFVGHISQHRIEKMLAVIE